jgi:lysyl-tRNA synthetase class 2
VSRSNLGIGWQPTCGVEALLGRAEALTKIRRFFDERGVLEVETPLLGQAAGTDPHLQLFNTTFRQPGQIEGISLYLQTSPEFAMKRLLASGSGSIYQICKAFRNEECGHHHNPEFTLLEWYRIGFGLDQLIDEIEALLIVLFGGQRELNPAKRISYRQLFEERVGIDPLLDDLQAFAESANRHNLSEATALCGEDKNIWLDLLFSHIVQPSMERGRVYFIYDYPACLPSLARKKSGDEAIVERVEVFLDGLELGNGFHELADSCEQERRFDADLAIRRKAGLPLPPKDQRLLDALAHGLPDCSGVAIGLDRLLMLVTGAEEIAQVLTFPIFRS